MSTFLILIGIIAIYVIIRFLRALNIQEKKVAVEGGMKRKYSMLVNWALDSHPDARIIQETPSSISVGVKGVSGSTTFQFVQTFGTVTVQYIVRDVVMGNHTLEWSFPEYGNQEEMISKIEREISNYVFNF